MATTFYKIGRVDNVEYVGVFAPEGIAAKRVTGEAVKCLCEDRSVALVVVVRGCAAPAHIVTLRPSDQKMPTWPRIRGVWTQLIDRLLPRLKTEDTPIAAWLRAIRNLPEAGPVSSATFEKRAPIA